jgi:hypothetical protein
MSTQISIDRRHIWLTAPLLIALAGAMGTFGGALLQGYWNNLLERHKFEYVLIQQALSTPTRKQSAETLDFLLKIGLLRGLDSAGVASASQDNGNQLPFLGTALRDQIIRVHQAKAVLSELNFYTGRIDDLTDIDYRIAVMKFQRERQLTVDGYIGPRTVLAMWEACDACPGLLKIELPIGNQAQ